MKISEISLKKMIGDELKKISEGLWEEEEDFIAMPPTKAAKLKPSRTAAKIPDEQFLTVAEVLGDAIESASYEYAETGNYESLERAKESLKEFVISFIDNY